MALLTTYNVYGQYYGGGERAIPNFYNILIFVSELVISKITFHFQIFN